MLRDPYQTYVENALVGSNPMQLVVVMYETAIRRTQEARSCLESGDIWGRARAITKTSNILLELRASLKPEAGDICGTLEQLYRYMQKRLQQAHVNKSEAPLIEVEKILCNLLEAWQKVEASERAKTAQVQVSETATRECEDTLSPYGREIFEGAPGRTLTLSA